MMPGVAPSILERAQNIRLLICDVDGVLTDGRLYFTPEGEELKSFHARDGHGIKLVQRAGIDTAVISGRNSKAVALRMESLGVRHVFQGQEHKLPTFLNLLEELGITADQVAFVGDDLLDLPLLRRVGLAVAVADSHFTILNSAHWITSQPGGMGAVREVCDLLLTAQNKLEAIIESYH
jgi:3-deoxy-D-manno-octulosonate 8-phosphate phosphatase (KDO 8-P phosphatase)